MKNFGWFKAFLDHVVFCFVYCSAWLKLNPKLGLDHPTTQPPQTFQLLLDILESWNFAQTFWQNCKGRILGPCLQLSYWHLSRQNMSWQHFSISAISQLILARFWPNFKVRVLGPSLKDANCHGDICPGNHCAICPGNIWTISPSHSKNMLILVKIAIGRSNNLRFNLIPDPVGHFGLCAARLVFNLHPSNPT